MPVTHDYHCPKHGYFENTEPRCLKKRCQEEVMMVFLQAPAIGSSRTSGIDKTAKQLAIDFNMTDIKTTREGESQQGYLTRNNNREPRPGDAAIWGGSSRFDMKSALMGRYAKPVRDEPTGVHPKSVGNLKGPVAASYIADHENLAVK